MLWEAQRQVARVGQVAAAGVGRARPPLLLLLLLAAHLCVKGCLVRGWAGGGSQVGAALVAVGPTPQQHQQLREWCVCVGGGGRRVSHNT